MAEIKLLPEGASRISMHDAPGRLKIEISLIKAHPLVQKESLKIWERNGCFVVTCELERELGGKTINDSIRRYEPVAICFPPQKFIGETAPRIFSNRKDFPRDLPHLNPVADSSPVSFCIWRNGIQALYNAGGTTKVLSVFGEWLSDASQGRLEHDGWEPVPRLGVHQLYANIGDFQRYVAGQKGENGGIVYGGDGFGFIEKISGGSCVRLKIDVSQQYESFVLNGRIIKDAEELQPNLVQVPWILMWSKKSDPIHERYCVQIDSEETLTAFANHAGLEHYISSFLDWLSASQSAIDSGIFVMLFGIWRPQELIQDIPSDASGLARKVEIVPILVETARSKEGTIIKHVGQFTLFEIPSSALLRKTSGREPLDRQRKAIVVGCGAVGSKLIDHLGREGFDQMILVDYDPFLPHNIARHILGAVYVGINKADALKIHLRVLFGIDVQSIPKPIQYLKTKERDKIKRSHVLIDSTADKQVANYLCSDNSLPRCVRVFLAWGGRLGVLMIEGAKHLPRVDDIEAILFLQSIKNSYVSKWLQSENAGQHTIIGISCSSVTFQIPDSLVSLHTANFIPKISSILDESGSAEGGIGLHIASPEGQSIGWEWIQVPEFKTFKTASNIGEWTIRIHPDVIRKMKRTFADHPVNETGGYMYGRFNVNQRVATIVETHCPLPLISTPVGLVLPAADQTERDFEIRHASNDLLIMLGSWHSHITNSSRQSVVDIDTMRKMSVVNNEIPKPFVMLIINKSGIRSSISLPTEWLTQETK